MTWLLDGNVLVALAIDSHEFHARARTWFDAQTEPFATCAVTEGTLLRVHMRLAVDRPRPPHGRCSTPSTRWRLTSFGMRASATGRSIRPP